MTEVGNEAASTPTGRRCPRWVSWLLIASLAVNLLVIGAAATAAWRHRNWDPSMGRPGGVLGFTFTLPGPRRAEVMGKVAADRQALRPIRAELRRLRMEVASALAATPFDPQRFEKAREELLATELRARTSANKFNSAIISQFTDDERVRLGRWLERHEGRSWRRSRWRRQQGEGQPSPAPAPN